MGCLLDSLRRGLLFGRTDVQGLPYHDADRAAVGDEAAGIAENPPSRDHEGGDADDSLYPSLPLSECSALDGEVLVDVVLTKSPAAKERGEKAGGDVGVAGLGGGLP